MKCRECGRYTLKKDKCPTCGGELFNPSPPKFSLEDPHLKLKIKAIMERNT